MAQLASFVSARTNSTDLRLPQTDARGNSPFVLCKSRTLSKSWQSIDRRNCFLHLVSATYYKLCFWHQSCNHPSDVSGDERLRGHRPEI